MTPTNEDHIVILEKEEGRVVYQNITTNDKWEILGTCNGCGECEIGTIDRDFIVWTGVPIGEPGACYNSLGSSEERGDDPITLPKIGTLHDGWPNCTLTGNYL